MTEEIKPAPIKPAITFADLDRIDVRVGMILSVDDVAGSDKLLKLTVDFGEHQRSILAGMKQERENPREIEGKSIVRDQSRTEKDDGPVVGRHAVRRWVRRRYRTGVGNSGPSRSEWDASGMRSTT